MYTSRFMKAAGYLTAVIALTAVISSAARAQAKAEDYPAPKPAFAGQTNAPAPAKPSPALKVETIIQRFNGAWSLAFLPNGKMLVVRTVRVPTRRGDEWILLRAHCQHAGRQDRRRRISSRRGRGS